MVTRGHHRGGMFRGGRSGGFRGGRNSARNSVFIPFQPFDIEHCEHHFPRMETETAEDSKLGEMLLQRNKMLVPNTDTISTFDSMLNQVRYSRIHGACDLLGFSSSVEIFRLLLIEKQKNLLFEFYGILMIF